MSKLRIYIICTLLGSVVLAQEIPHTDGNVSMETRGDTYYEEMAYKKALDEYSRALEKYPEDKGLQLKIAKCYDKLNNPEEVAYHSSYAVSHSSSTADDVYNYAEALAATENYEKADKIYARYARMNGSDSRVGLKKEGIKNIENLYNDSLGYRVNPASFNTQETEFGPAFIGGELYFVSNRGKSGMFQRIDMRDETKFLDVYKLSGDMPIKIKEIGEKLHEGPMTELEQGKILITENYPDSRKNSDRESITKLRLVVYENGSEGWEMTEEFPLNDQGYSIGHPTFDKENSVLYFASNMSGGKGGVDLYKVSYENGEWGAAENLEALNTEGDEMFPFISGDDLYFSSDGRGGLGGLDIYTTKVSGGPIYTLGFPVNSSRDDFGIALREDGKTGYFCSNRIEGEGKDDIYEVEIYKLRVDAQAIDEETSNIVGGNWRIVDSLTGDEAKYVKENDKAVFDALRGRSYTITTDDEYYAESSGSISANTKEERLSVKVPMKRTKAAVQIEGASGTEYIVVHNLANPEYYKLGATKLEPISESDLTDDFEKIVIEDVFFKFNSDEFVSGINEIDKVIAILKGYESADVEITAYCDARGSAKYNEKLAEKRAKRVEDYMISNGIEPDRITSVSIGKAELYNDCTRCNEEQHQQNRRVEFTLKIN